MMKQIKSAILALFMFFVTHSLCLLYSFFAVVYLFVQYLKYDPKFWNPKVRTQPPACLSNPEFGTHNYIQANVSTEFIFFSFQIRKFFSIKKEKYSRFNYTFRVCISIQNTWLI